MNSDTNKRLLELVIDGGVLSDKLKADISEAYYESDVYFAGQLAGFLANEIGFKDKAFFLVSCIAKDCRNKGGVTKSSVAYLCATVVNSPEDAMMLLNFVGRPIPSSIRVGLQRCLNRFTQCEYEASQKRVGKFSLVDVFNLIRPKPKNEIQEAIFKKVLNGTLRKESSYKLSQVSDIEKIKKHAESCGLEVGMILKNIDGILLSSDDELIELATSTLKQVEMVKNSKRLPTEFLKAMRRVDKLNKKRHLPHFGKFMSSLSFASSHASANVKQIEGKTAFLIDSSKGLKSNVYDCLSTAHERNNASTGMLYASVVKSANKYTDVFAFADVVVNITPVAGFNVFNSFNTMFDVAQKLNSHSRDGLLDFLSNIPEKYLGYNNIVIFSDSEVLKDKLLMSKIAIYRSFHKYTKFTIVDLGGSAEQNLIGDIKVIPWHSDALLDIIRLGDIETVVRGYRL